jgi:hypothetical protein
MQGIGRETSEADRLNENVLRIPWFVVRQADLPNARDLIHRMGATRYAMAKTGVTIVLRHSGVRRLFASMTLKGINASAHEGRVER